MDRLEQARVIADQVLLDITDPLERRQGQAHIYGVSDCAVLLALKRGLDPEISAIAGVLHDLYRLKTGIAYLHDHNGAEFMRPVVRDLNIFTPEEQRLILSSIFHHSDKQNQHHPHAEVLKDADVLQHFLAKPMPIPRDALRLERILRELELPIEYNEGPSHSMHPTVDPATDRRSKLADIAESLAAKRICGLPEDENFRKLCHYWPERDVHKQLQGGWCAAFVYHCCMEAGIILPLRHPQVTVRFAGVKAWVQWAELPECKFFYNNEQGCVPSRGDIVVFNALVSDKPLDHIGVVLSVDGSLMTVAEGNMDNSNQAGISCRITTDNVAGFFRISNYRYQYNGAYS